MEVVVTVAVPTKFSWTSLLQSDVGQYSRPTCTATPNWQPYRLGFISSILLTWSPVRVAAALSITRTPNSLFAQPPLPSGPLMISPLILTLAVEPQMNTMACGTNKLSL